MIDIDILGKYQQHLLDINSADYKYEVLKNCISYIKNLVENGEFDFLTISDEVNNIYVNNNYFYDYLENKLTYSKKVENKEYYDGYNELNIEALLYGIYNPDPNFIIHDEIYANLNNIYKNFFSNMSEHSIYSIFYNNFKIDTLNPSNYLKVCFNKENRNLKYKMANVYIAPMYDFSRICTPQILTSIRRTVYDEVLEQLPNSILKLTDITNLNTGLSRFILFNIFNDFDFNTSYENEIKTSIDISGLTSIFNDYIDKLTPNNVTTCINNMYKDFIQEFSYILMTKGRELGLIKFDLSPDIYKNSIFATEDVSYKDDSTISDYLLLKEIPSIFCQLSDSSFLIRFQNVDYKVTNRTQTTYNRLNSIASMNVKGTDGYINSLKTKFISSSGYNPNYLEELGKKAIILKKSTIKYPTVKNSIYKTLIDDILKRIEDMKSIVTLTYKYRNEPLQFINSNLAAFSDWLDLILNTQYSNAEYVDVLNTTEIGTIVSSINFVNIGSDGKPVYPLVDFINSNFIELFKTSKVIDLNVYRYLGELVDGFIKTQSFKDYILFKFIEPIAQSLKTRSPRLYKEIYQNIDNVINYVKFLLILHLYESSDLSNKYRYILATATEKDENGIDQLLHIKNFDNEVLQLLIEEFNIIDSVSVDAYKDEATKFTTSMAVLFLLDKYIDGFRLLKKFQTYNIEKVTFDRISSIVTVHLDDIHNLELGRGVTIIGNTGNINGYKLVYSPEDRGTQHFTFYQPDAKPGQGGTINIKRELDKTYIIKNSSFDEYHKIVTIYLDKSHDLDIGQGFTVAGNTGNIDGYKINSSNNKNQDYITFYQANAILGDGGIITVKPH